MSTSKFRAPKHIDYLIAFHRDGDDTPCMTTFSNGGHLKYNASMLIFGEALAADSLLEEEDKIQLEKFCHYYLEARKNDGPTT